MALEQVCRARELEMERLLVFRTENGRLQNPDIDITRAYGKSEDPGRAHMVYVFDDPDDAAQIMLAVDTNNARFGNGVFPRRVKPVGVIFHRGTVFDWTEEPSVEGWNRVFDDIAALGPVDG